MSDLEARTGRHQQLYDGGCRLVAGCIPYKYRDSDESSGKISQRIVEVLMINTPSGPVFCSQRIDQSGFSNVWTRVLIIIREYLFSLKHQSYGGGWENDETVEEAAVREAVEEAGVRGELKDCLGMYEFKSKTQQDESCAEGLCKASMYALWVTEELESWPEQSTRSRKWLTIPEAAQKCRHAWMREALLQGFAKWHDKISREK